MDGQANLLIISDDFSLYETIKKASVAVDFSLYFSQTDDDYLAIVRENGIRVVLVDSGDSIAGALIVLKKLKKFDPLLDVLIGGEPLDRDAILDVVHAGATDFWMDVARSGGFAANVHVEGSLARPFIFKMHLDSLGPAKGIMGSSAPRNSLVFEWEQYLAELGEEQYKDVFGGNLARLLGLPGGAA